VLYNSNNYGLWYLYMDYIYIWLVVKKTILKNDGVKVNRKDYPIYYGTYYIYVYTHMLHGAGI
jgi:hypothetical protein